MYFQHSSEIWAEHPDLVAGAVFATDIAGDSRYELAEFHAVAEERLASGPESEFPEIQAWRRTFAKMGLKPTQYRCASEALLRRFRKERDLPRIHPLIDLCNAVSIAYAIPIAAIDLGQVADGLEVRPATGEETYQTFGGDIENPAPGEVIFADAQNRAHARRWTNRQSGLSAVRDTTTTVLIVAEALHDTAASDVPKLIDALSTQLGAKSSAILSQASPGFEYPGVGEAP